MYSKNIIFCLFLIMPVQGLLALSLAKIPDGVLVNQASCIAYGVLESAVPVKNGKMIFTRYSVKIKDKGLIKSGASHVKNNIVEFYLPGGSIGPESLEVPGLVKLSPGKEYVIFFKDGKPGLTVFGANQGVFPVIIDPISGERIVIKKYEPRVLTMGTRISDKDKKDKKAALTDFIAWIKNTGGYK